MNELMNRLYEEIYSPKITPQELLQNARLENYLYVNAFSKDGFLWLESSCYIAGGEKVLYSYKFDEHDHLLQMTSHMDGETHVEYDRAEHIRRIHSELSRAIRHKSVG